MFNLRDDAPGFVRQEQVIDYEENATAFEDSPTPEGDSGLPTITVTVTCPMCQQPVVAEAEIDVSYVAQNDYVFNDTSYGREYLSFAATGTATHDCSATSMVQTPETPRPPAAVTVESEWPNINLSWLEPYATDPDAPPILGYRIERTSGSDGWDQAEIVAENTGNTNLEYTDTMVPAGDYSYRITGINQSGLGGSGFSDIVYHIEPGIDT